MASPLGLPAPSGREQCRAVLVVGIALGLTGLLATALPGVTLLPPLGASAILLAALPNAPVARLWPLIGGTLLAAVLAWLLNQLHLPLWLTCPLATCVALLAMYHLRCLHPPGGAMAVWVALYPDSFASLPALLLAVLPGLLLLAAAALLRQRLYGRTGMADDAGHDTSDAPPSLRHAPGPADWQQALDRHGELLDIGPAQLHRLHRELEAARLHRRVGPACVGDVMARDLVTLAPSDSAQTAWQTLQHHRIKTIPVVADGQVLGVISLVDLLKYLGLNRPTLPEDLTARANVVMRQDVAQLMSAPARTVRADLPLDALVPLLSDWGLHHLPVVDAEGVLVGMVTQSDLIAGLSHLLTRSAERTSP